MAVEVDLPGSPVTAVRMFEWTRDDRQMAEKSQHYCEQNRLIDWDGTTDRTDVFRSEHVHANLALYADIDEVLAKPMLRITPELLECGNRSSASSAGSRRFPTPRACSSPAARPTTSTRRSSICSRYMQERGIDPDVLPS